ncbi:MAG: Single-stranded-DNA-specific exonuclease RecJ (EC [uncultured Thiotrichaceae bacterium]|uniref:Single-stranded-DNA-specific exonuclease RecJ n=1 Tax=uncultured Thiotrichaceae bacterium TaxID=298394 RepID=A0A6S6UB80_9GAMM|nr:MAG: Single-stranded-DNA-specific exonuclease RecJ (EC [uncultured Thiotrichaceae bacterium]
MKLVIRESAGTYLTGDTSTLSPLLQRIFSARQIYDDSELAFSLKQLLPIRSLGNIEAASTLLAETIANQQKILIIGDFDADGATATAVAVRALRIMGHQNVHYLVPNRFEYGYGLTPEIVVEAARFSPDLIITVDNGISSISGVATAKEAGYKVLVTDHHLPGSELPEADVIVNPNLVDNGFASKNLAGVGVIFYVMLALKKRLSEQGYFSKHAITPPNLLSLLDLVALGTIADVVPLDKNNRILVAQGLQRIRAQQACAGVLALFQIAGKNSQRAVTSDIGFACGPRLNAAGRLDDMSMGIELLLCDNPQQALNIAAKLDHLNKERRAIEDNMKVEALHELEHLDSLNDSNIPPIICLYNETWHQGVVGILASRIKEKYNRPTIIFAPGENGEIKGSARSIKGLHIRDILDEVATQNKDLLSKFGGHAMAAGLSFMACDFENFTRAITKVVIKHSNKDTFREIQHTDGVLQPEEFSLETAEALRYAAPWGQHFPEPQFHGDFVIMQKRILKDAHIKLMLRPKDDTKLSIDAITFNADLAAWPEIGESVSLLYHLDVNEFSGSLTPQMMISALL